MKPDGVATTPAEPAEDVVEPVPEGAANQEQVQQDLSPSSPQPENPENVSEQEGANATLLPGMEVNGKPKDKSKAPVKPKPAGTKATTTTGTVSRPATAQNRVANGVTKTASNGASKKPVSMTSEMKKKSAQVKKVPTASAVPPRAQVKAAEQKAVGSARAIPSTSSGIRKTAAAATSSTLSKKPVAAGSNATLKPKTTGTTQMNYSAPFQSLSFSQPIYSSLLQCQSLLLHLLPKPVFQLLPKLPLFPRQPGTVM